MVLLGLFGFCSSVFLCGVFLAAGIRGWLAPLPAFGCFILARMLYGTFGAAAPPAAQAIIAGSTSREERTRALTLLGSGFGLGTILGPALARPGRAGVRILGFRPGGVDRHGALPAGRRTGLGLGCGVQLSVDRR
jgi:MFS family permease